MKVSKLITILKSQEKCVSVLKLLEQANPDHEVTNIEDDGKGLGTRGYDTPGWFKWKVINFIKRYF